jgi:hypothetical protein
MWTVCKELKGTQSLGERDPLLCRKIISCIYYARRDQSRPFRLDLPFCRELGDIPPATQRFDQLHAARHLL